MPLPNVVSMPSLSQTALLANWRRNSRLAVLGLLPVMLVACQPTVRVQAPDKPIEINLNVKIEQEVRVKVEREVEDLFAENPDIF